MSRKPKGYWEKRSTELLKNIEDNTIFTINDLITAYNKATNDINNEIKKVYNKYVSENKLTKKEAMTLLSQQETDKFYKKLLEKISIIDDEDIKSKLLAKYNAPAYAYRISRYQALQDNIDIELKKLASIEKELTKIRYVDTITDGYYRSIFDIQKGLNSGFNFSQIDKRTINLMLNNKWNNKSNYSDRIWHNSEKLSDYLRTSMIADTMTGKSIKKMSSELNQAMEVGLYNATRLVRTETNYFANQAEILSYEECGIEKYQFISTLDRITCEHCAGLDKRIFNVKEAKPGKNCPPIHPNDRCTTVAYFGENDEDIKRIARDPKTGNNYYIDSNISYEEWQKQYGEDRVKKYHKMYVNESKDKEQYRRYISSLGKERYLKSFDSFQEIKYNNSIEYDALKYEYNLKKHFNYAIDSGGLSPLVDFKLYKEMDSNVGFYLEGMKTTNGIEIKSYSKHFIDRVFGSIEERRNGVKLDEIIDTIRNSSNFRESKRNGSIKIIGYKCIVSINPTTGNLIQVNPQ